MIFEVGNIKTVIENATLLEENDHVTLEDMLHPLHNFKFQIHNVSDDCITLTTRNQSDLSHIINNFLMCRSFRANDADVEAFKQRSRCRDLNHIVVRQNDFEYASKCHSVEYQLDPLDVNSILGVWQIVARAGKDLKRKDTEIDPWTKISMDGDLVKIEESHGSLKYTSEGKVNGSTILMKYKNSSFVITFYPTCKECLLMRIELERDGDVLLYLLNRSGKLTPEEVEQFKDDVRCLSLLVVSVLQDDHKQEGKDDQ